MGYVLLHFSKFLAYLLFFIIFMVLLHLYEKLNKRRPFHWQIHFGVGGVGFSMYYMYLHRARTTIFLPPPPSLPGLRISNACMRACELPMLFLLFLVPLMVFSFVMKRECPLGLISLSDFQTKSSNLAILGL